MYTVVSPRAKAANNKAKELKTTEALASSASMLLHEAL